jgi:sugar/nucleoside kinase (ribokinase family)
VNFSAHPKLTFLQCCRSDHEVTKNPGGCVQNSLRIIQSLVKEPSFSVFFGGLGCDSDGTFLESEVKKCGVETRLVIFWIFLCLTDNVT